MELTYKNILIRNAEEEDASLLARWWNSGSVMAHAGFPLGLGTTPERITNDLRSDTDETRRRLMLLVDNIPVGEMVYRNIGHNTADIGIKICNTDYQEKGIGRIALSLLIRAVSIGIPENRAGYEPEKCTGTACVRNPWLSKASGQYGFLEKSARAAGILCGL